MTFEKINELIEKYFAGETSLEDEKILRGYFSGTDVDARLATYAPLFQFFEAEKKVVFSDEKMPKFSETPVVALQKQPFLLKILRGGQVWKIAAAIAFLVVASIGVTKIMEQKSSELAQQTALPKKKKAKIILLDETTNPDSALVQVNMALALVSKKMKKGTDETTSGLLKLKDATSILNN